jgi:predicted outer membrane repeat protein
MWVTSVFGSDLYVDWQQQSGPYKDIQSAILAAVPGDVIHVGDGTYPGNLLVQKAITIISENGPEKTIIDCAGSGVGVTFKGAGANGAVLSGFKITGGNASQGGAIACSQSSPIISYCVMENNVASYGGGLFVRNVDATDPSPILIGCTIANNSAFRGGGVFLHTFASPAFYNCLIVGNSASERGGAFYCYYECAPDIIHCTVSDNTAADGGGIYCLSCFDPYYPVVTNSIIWGNIAASGAQIYLSNSIIDITFSSFDLGAANNIQLFGTSSSMAEDGSNIHDNPAFIGEGDYRLGPDSPCIDSGTDQIELPEFDMEGEARVIGRAPDMGSYEFVPEVKVIQVEIDIKPESTENKINLKSWGLLAVAVKTTEDFDAKSIDPGTVLFAGATPVWQICYDVDRDGDKDMLFFFRVQKLVELNEDSTQATLTGMTKDGKSFEGTDSVTIIKPKGKAIGWRFGKR